MGGDQPATRVSDVAPSSPARRQAPGGRGSRPVAGLEVLQRAAGNRAVAGLVAVQRNGRDDRGHAAGPDHGGSPVGGPRPPAGSGEMWRLHHGTTQAGFAAMGGFGPGQLDVSRSRSGHDLGPGIYFAFDATDAVVYGERENPRPTTPEWSRGRSLRSLVFDIPRSELGVIVDIRPGGTHFERWEAFMNEPLLPPEMAARARAARLPVMTRRDLYRTNQRPRDQVFAEFLRLNNLDPDTIVAPHGGDTFTGPGSGTQVCIRRQTIADRLNRMMAPSSPANGRAPARGVETTPRAPSAAPGAAATEEAGVAPARQARPSQARPSSIPPSRLPSGTRSPGARPTPVAEPVASVGERMRPLGTVGPNPRGEAAGQGALLALSMVGTALNMYVEHREAPRVRAAIARVEAQVAAHQREHPEHGALLTVHYHQSSHPDAVIGSARLFGFVDVHYGASREEANVDRAGEATLAPDRGPLGHELREDHWIAPLRRPAATALQTPFAVAAHAAPVANRITLVDVTFDQIQGFDDAGTSTLAFPPGTVGLFSVLSLPDNIDFTDVARIRRPAASGGDVPALQLDTVLGDYPAVCVFPANDDTLRAVEGAGRAPAGIREPFPNLRLARFVRPGSLRVVAAPRD